MYPVCPWNLTLVHSPEVPSFLSLTPTSTLPKTSASVLALARTLQISFVLTLPVFLVSFLEESSLDESSVFVSSFVFTASCLVSVCSLFSVLSAFCVSSSCVLSVLSVPACVSSVLDAAIVSPVGNYGSECSTYHIRKLVITGYRLIILRLYLIL